MIQARAVQASGAGPGYVVSRTLPLKRNSRAWFLQEAALCSPVHRFSLAAKIHVPVNFDRDLSRSVFTGALSAAELHSSVLDKFRQPAEHVPPSRIKEEAALVVKSPWRA